MYSISFTVTEKKLCLSLHYNGVNSYFFVNGTEIYKLKAKDSEIVATPLCLGNISKDWSIDNIKRQDLMHMSMILVLIMMLLMLMILKIFTIIWWRKMILYKNFRFIKKFFSLDRWNKNKCRCECKELNNKGVCSKDFIWNPSNCECECKKSCDFSEYLD